MSLARILNLVKAKIFLFEIFWQHCAKYDSSGLSVLFGLFRVFCVKEHGEGKMLLNPPRISLCRFSRYNALLCRSAKGPLRRCAPLAGSFRDGFLYARSGSGEIVRPAVSQESMEGHTF
jgi:hypothetical protein